MKRRGFLASLAAAVSGAILAPFLPRVSATAAMGGNGEA